MSDTGSGIAAENQAHLFEPFFTTKFTGRGLGLAAVLGIVRSHRGAIQLESQPGAGACFRVLLPLQADAARSEPVPSERAAAQIGTGHILVVDDDEAILRLMQAFLEDAGFEVTTVLGGRAGIETIRRTPQRFDAVVLDLVMPDVDGARVFEAIRRIRPDLPVILVSGYAEEAARSLLGERQRRELPAQALRARGAGGASAGGLSRPRRGLTTRAHARARLERAPRLALARPRRRRAHASRALEDLLDRLELAPRAR